MLLPYFRLIKQRIVPETLPGILNPSGKILILICPIFLLFPLLLNAQEKKKEPVEILNADVLTIFQSDSGTVRQMTGNVKFRQDSVLMFCDSALHYAELNYLEAHKRVKIIISDTTIITGDVLNYDGESKVADLFRNVVMKDGATVLKTERLRYFRLTGIAVYPQKGRIEDGDNILTSETGFFHTESNRAYFRKNVRLDNPEFRLETDTLAYHTETKTALFIDPTFIFTKTDTLFTTDGWYDTRARKAELYSRSWMRDSTYQISADTLMYDEGNNFGEGIGNVHLMKKDSTVEIRGACGEFLRAQGSSLVYGEPWMVYKMEDDTLHLLARHFKAVQDTLQDSTLIHAYPEVRLLMRNLQGICDSLVYSEKDSLLYLLQDPVIWSEENQASGDTILLWMKNEAADSVRIKQKCFLITREDTVGFNQVKGKQIYGKFRDNELYRMLVSGNAESIYFSKNEEKNTYEGVNQSLSNDILMYFGENKPLRITFITKPEGSFSPMFEVIDNSPKLEDFRWRPEDRPGHRKALGALPWPEAIRYIELFEEGNEDVGEEIMELGE